jgi:hypothetical protein
MSEDFDVKQRTETIYERWRSENNKKFSDKHSKEDGDMLILTTNFRPVKGSKGYYHVQMKHGISEVHNGSRYTLGIIFHDALS